MSDTLYDGVGGVEGLQTLSNAFYRRALDDDLLKPVFANFTPTHVQHVAVWLAEVFGGPEQFTAELGGHQALLRSHLGLSITEEQRQRWLALMADAVDEVWPGQPALHEVLMSYFDWGTTIAKDVSQQPAGTDLGKPGATPRWTYGGLKT